MVAIAACHDVTAAGVRGRARKVAIASAYPATMAAMPRSSASRPLALVGGSQKSKARFARGIKSQVSRTTLTMLPMNVDTARGREASQGERRCNWSMTVGYKTSRTIMACFQSAGRPAPPGPVEPAPNHAGKAPLKRST